MNVKLFLFAFTAAIGGLLFGFDTAVVYGTTDSIKAYFGMTETMKGWAVSSALVGCIVGALAVGKPGDIFGRRKMLFVSAILFFVSAVWTGAAQTLTGFVTARIIGGLGVGAASVMAPMYIAEISPARLRGRLVSTAQLAIVTGIVGAFFSNYVLALMIDENAWRYMYWAECLPAGLYFVLLFLTSPSPRWLVKVGRVDQARNVIQLVDEEENTETVLADIRESLAHEERSKGINPFSQTVSTAGYHRHDCWHVQPVYGHQYHHVLCARHFQSCGLWRERGLSCSSRKWKSLFVRVRINP